MNYLVTGGTGFVGSRLVEYLVSDRRKVSIVARNFSSQCNLKIKQIVADLNDMENLPSELCAGFDSIIHLAACNNLTKGFENEPVAEYRKINRDATLKLATKAASSGVKRFVYVSSIKVNGEVTLPNRAFHPNDCSKPYDLYSLSKYEAEEGLFKIATETGMEVVIVRPPMVYGPGVKSNFAVITSWTTKNIPLPLGAVDNKRSFIALDNLVDFLVLCADTKRSPQAANKVFLISDGEDVSTPDLVRKIANAYGKKTWLIPIPTPLLRFVAKLLGKSDIVSRLLDNLQIDSTSASDLLGWNPVITMDGQLKKMAEIDLK